MAPPVVPGKKKKTVDTKKALSKGFGGIKVKGKSITKTEVIKKIKKKSTLFSRNLLNLLKPRQNPKTALRQMSLLLQAILLDLTTLPTVTRIDFLYFRLFQ